MHREHHPPVLARGPFRDVGADDGLAKAGSGLSEDRIGLEHGLTEVGDELVLRGVELDGHPVCLPVWPSALTRAPGVAG